MNMYRHELWSLRKVVIAWTIAMTALAVLYFSIYPSIVKDADSFKQLLGNYPAAIRQVLGISLDTITSVVGFYSMVFTFITLCGAMQAMILGTSVLSRETRERTADFLLVKPVSRSKIVSSKLLASLTALVVTNIVYYAAILIVVSFVKIEDYSDKLFFLVNSTLFFIQLIFFAIGFVIGVILPKLKSVIPVSVAVVFGFFFVGAFLASESTSFERYLSPFKYFDTQYIIKNSAYETRFLIVGALIVAVTIIASYIIYIKKDIHSVS